MKLRQLRKRQQARAMHPVCEHSFRSRYDFPYCMRNWWKDVSQRRSKRALTNITSIRCTVHRPR